ncbi:aminotransferase family protein [Ferviditalea candida]|uniref:Aspartate aminotransferase family protein n=1 Tax=Ferviditalea candida TaxID=3108399 RepID=A0ABU5ZGZ6_9BACL|nr:aspartate aminotransferase family protein [Paenibacillaceae bacterium T2]
MSNLSELIELDKKHCLHPSSPIKDHYSQGPMVLMEKGQGIYLYDFNGKEYIDGLSSLWNVNIGHGRAELAEAAREQMSRLAFSHSFNRFSHRGAIELAEKLASLTPGDLSVTQFTSGGSESNDTAFKLARHYFKLKGQPNRYKIISRYRAYHGISMGATSATGIPVFRQMGGPLAEGFLHAAAPYCYRCEEEDCTGYSIKSIEDIIQSEGPKTVAAVIVEPIQGAGGVIVPPLGYLKEIRRICDKYGILMIADEVITGFGRTGKWFGVEYDGVVPDMMSIAKGITSGYIPLGGVVIRGSIHQELVANSQESAILPHGFTYSGHPTACAVALKNLEIMADEKLVDNAAKMGLLLQEGLKKMRDELDIVGNFMSRGLIGSIEIVQEKATKKPFSKELNAANRVFAKALENGLITRAISIDQTDMVAVCPPLIINELELQRMLDILYESIKEVQRDI